MTQDRDDARLEDLLGRLGELEAGLRSELATQVERADDAEAALAAAEARATRAEVAARAPVLGPVVPSPGGADGAAALGGAGAPSSGEDRAALAAALREVRSYLERRRTLEIEIVTIARDAVGALRQGR